MSLTDTSLEIGNQNVCCTAHDAFLTSPLSSVRNDWCFPSLSFAVLWALCFRASGQSSPGGTSFTPPDLALLSKMLTWPPAQLFPALDLARLVALEPGGAVWLAQGAGGVGDSEAGAHWMGLEWGAKGENLYVLCW